MAGVSPPNLRQLYPWAGELRTVQIAKPNAFYARPEHIASYAQGIFAELARENHLKGLDRGAFLERLTPYGIRQGDLIAFTRQHRPPGEARVENGTRGEIAALRPNGGATIALDGSDRHIELAPEDLGSLRLAYAQHVYRQQGATVECSIVLTGGWQTSKETAYVEASRARQRTDWYIAREDLGTEAQGSQRIKRLAQRMAQSRAQTPSSIYRERPKGARRSTRYRTEQTDPFPLTDWPHWPQGPELPNQDIGRER